MLNVIADNGVFAGNDHEVAVSWFQVDGVMAAVAPGGIPLIDNVTGTGKSVPAVGVTDNG